MSFMFIKWNVNKASTNVIIAKSSTSTFMMASPTNSCCVLAAACLGMIREIRGGKPCSRPPFTLNPRPPSCSRRTATVRTWGRGNHGSLRALVFRGDNFRSTETGSRDFSEFGTSKISLPCTFMTTFNTFVSSYHLKVINLRKFLGTHSA